jgi:hypothetical protein
VCEYAQAEAGCNGPMAVARELRRVTPDRCMEAAVRVAELCQEAADALERSVPLEGEARELIKELWGALNFILAFYEPGQRYLDTEAWKRAEAGGRAAHAKAAAYIERTAQAQGPVTDEMVGSDTDKAAGEYAEEHFGTAGGLHWQGPIAEAFKAGASHERSRLQAVLRGHWLTGIVCDHETKTDRATCWCTTWQCEPQPSVGAAVERWIEHVLDAQRMRSKG